MVILTLLILDHLFKSLIFLRVFSVDTVRNAGGEK